MAPVSTISSFPLTHIQRTRDELAPGTAFSKASESLAVSIDTISFARNGLSAGANFKGAEAVSKVSKIFNSLVLAGGILAFLAGSGIVKTTGERLKTAHDRKNWEGAVSHGTLGAVGAAYAVSGVGMVVAESAVFASAAQAVSIGTSIFTVGSIALYGFFALHGSYGLLLNHRFSHQLNQRLSLGNSEKERLSHAFEWLFDRLGRAASETELQKKWDQFASYTSESCCRYLREHITPEFLKKLKGGDPAALSHAKWMIQEVKRANSKQKAVHTLSLLISALGIAAVVLSIIGATGPFSPLLFAIGAIFWLFFDSSFLKEKFTEKVYGKSEIPQARVV